MDLIKTFKTANGYCHIFLDRLVLSPHENPDEPVEEKSNRFFFVILYSLVFVVLLAASIKGFFSEEYYWAVICLAVSFYFARRSVMVNSKSNSPIIERSAITNIEYFQSIYAVQAPQFIITIKFGKLGEYKKVVYLGSIYSNDKTEPEIAKAIQIMDEEFG